MEGGGIEISGRAITYLRFDTLSGVREVATFGAIRLPQGAIVDGDIRNTSAVVDTLAAVRKTCGFSFVHASLPEQKGYLFDLLLPRDPAVSLRESIELTLPTHVPLSPAEIVFDCETILSESDAGTRSVAVTAFSESVAQGYADVFTAAGFSPLSFELEPQAAARAILLRETYRGHALLLVDFSAGKTTLSVVQNGVVRFTMSAEGSGELTSALAALVPPGTDKTTEAVYAAIASMKYEQGLTPGGAGSEACARTASALGAVVKKVLVYWQSRAMNGEIREPVEEILLYGEDANIHGLCEFVSKMSGVSCRLANLRPAFGNESAVPPIEKSTSLAYATVLGLALRSGAHSL